MFILFYQSFPPRKIMFLAECNYQLKDEKWCFAQPQNTIFHLLLDILKILNKTQPPLLPEPTIQFHI